MRLKIFLGTIMMLIVVFTSVLATEVKAAPRPENVKQEDRIDYLFPKGVPQSEKEMKKYLKTIKVPVCVRKETKKGKVKLKKAYVKITVHKKLANNYKKAFKEMYKKKFPIKRNEVAAFAWRKTITTEKISVHSYGAAIDINWKNNPVINNGKSNKKNSYTITGDIANIWETYGFYWGENWTGNYKEPMHFEYIQ